MDKFIKIIEDLIAKYEEILKEKEDDEWLKGLIAGLLQAKQEAQFFDEQYINKENLLKTLNDGFDKIVNEHYSVETLKEVQKIIYQIKSM